MLQRPRGANEGASTRRETLMVREASTPWFITIETTTSVDYVVAVST